MKMEIGLTAIRIHDAVGKSSSISSSLVVAGRHETVKMMSPT
jgi:hypothetical protein